MEPEWSLTLAGEWTRLEALASKNNEDPAQLTWFDDVQFSHDGSEVAVLVNAPGEVLVFDAKDGTRTHHYRLPGEDLRWECQFYEFRLDGSLLILASTEPMGNDGDYATTVYVLDRQRERWASLWDFDARWDGPWAVHRETETAATVEIATDDDGVAQLQLVVRDLPTLRERARFSAAAPDQAISQEVCFDAAGQRIAPDTETCVEIFSLDGELLRTLEPPTGTIRELRFDSPTMLVAATDQSEIRWSLEDGDEPRVVDGSEPPPDPFRDEAIERCRRASAEHERAATQPACAYSPDGRRLAVLCGETVSVFSREPH